MAEITLAEFNMGIWNQVSTSDPKQLRKVEFGRKFLSIDAYPQIKRATEVLGPMGIKFGLREVHESFHEVNKGTQSEPYVKVNYLYMKACFWYMYPETDVVGLIEVANGMELTAKNDAPKKIVTNMLTKALSYLGFNYDVFEGSWDDDPYEGRPDIPAPKWMKHNYDLLLNCGAFNDELKEKLVEFQINAGWTMQSVTNFINTAPERIAKLKHEVPELLTEKEYDGLSKEPSQ